MAQIKRQNSKMKITKIYKENIQFLKKIKWYIVFSLSLFAIFMLIGFTFPIFFREQIFALLEKMILQFEGLSLLETITHIFLNNLRSSFFIIALGVAAGIFPLIALVSNAYLLGFVSYYAASHSGLFILWRILPHGIFELPAIIISLAIGFNIGVTIFKKNPKENLKKNYISAFKFFLFFIIPLLLIAAIIEGILIFYI